MHLLIYIAPICVKFQHDPLFATLLLQGILGTFKAYPTLADPGLFIAMVSVFPEIYSRKSFALLLLLIVVSPTTQLTRLFQQTSATPS